MHQRLQLQLRTMTNNKLEYTRNKLNAKTKTHQYFKINNKN